MRVKVTCPVTGECITPEHVMFFTKGERTLHDAASRTRSRTHIARILTRIPLNTKLLTRLVQWCATARVQPVVRLHGCCERSEGEHHSHQTDPDLEQSGRRRRHCTRRRLEGNGFDVFTMSVQGMCLLLPNMSLHIEV